MFAFKIDLIELTFGPISSGGKSVTAAGTGGVANDCSLPNCRAPSIFFALPGLEISKSIAETRFSSGSVPAIEPESSMIASIFVAGVQLVVVSAVAGVTYAVATAATSAIAANRGRT